MESRRYDNSRRYGNSRRCDKSTIRKPTMESRRCDKSTMESRRYATLPLDIIIQILHRLPVKSLLRFTSVSKTWKAIIESSSFVSAHMKIINNTRSPSFHLVYISIPLTKHDKDCTLIPEAIDGLPARIPLPRLWEGAWVIGSSEGLILLEEKSIMYLWNPFTGVVKRLPQGELQLDHDLLGFGFSPQSGDHKVVKLIECGHNYLTGVEIYSLALNSWRRVKLPSVPKKVFPMICLYSMISFEGSIYWLVSHKFKCPQMILRFDLVEETFEVIEVGVTTTNESKVVDGFVHGFDYQLMVVDGFLVLLESEVIYLVNWTSQKQLICLRGYIINKESESGSSSWVATETVELPMRAGDIRVAGLFEGSHNILASSPDSRLFVYEGYCDGKNLSFKRRDLGINFKSLDFSLIPIKETLLSFNVNGAKRKRV